MKPVEQSIQTFEQLWDTPPSLSINESRDLIAEIPSYGWQIYPSTHVEEVESLALRFMKYHAYTPGVLLSKMAVSLPTAVGQYESRGKTHKFALFHNGLTWQARQENTVVYTILAVDSETASRWSYPSSYLNIAALLQSMLSSIEEESQ